MVTFKELKYIFKKCLPIKYQYCICMNNIDVDPFTKNEMVGDALIAAEKSEKTMIIFYGDNHNEQLTIIKNCKN